jgi:16S rRNA (guanine527-N7)-methyltransferase
MTTLEFRDRLARRTRRAKAPIALNMLEPLEAYFRLLTQWNAKINLTALPLDAPTDETFDRLLVEPLGAAKQIPTDAPSVWFDLGSGGGSPAIPMKIARPALRLTMIESKERKSAFLREAIRSLGLAETFVATERFEVAAARPEFSGTGDIVTVRAVKADAELFQTAGRMLKDGGRLLLFRPAHSASADPPGFKRVTTVPLIDVPQSFLSVYRRVFHVEHPR